MNFPTRHYYERTTAQLLRDNFMHQQPRTYLGSERLDSRLDMNSLFCL